eukprot:scaffold47882_cov19-Prasinocladus_malaysianus.AAC.1
MHIRIKVTLFIPWKWTRTDKDFAPDWANVGKAVINSKSFSMPLKVGGVSAVCVEALCCLMPLVQTEVDGRRTFTILNACKLWEFQVLTWPSISLRILF